MKKEHLINSSFLNVLMYTQMLKEQSDHLEHARNAAQNPPIAEVSTSSFVP